MPAHHLSEFEFCKFDPQKQHKLLPSVIRCYQRVFADPPWQEWLHCKQCHREYGTNMTASLQIQNYMCCGTPIEEFWPASKVGQDLNRELIPNSSCWLAMHNETVVGFCWGFPITPEKLELKLGLPALAERIRAKFDVDSVAYQDEIGVLPEYRSQGIASAMFKKRHQDFRDQSLEIGVVRTKRMPPSVTYDWFTKRLQYETLASYEAGDGRVVLARNISTLFQEGA